MLKALAISIVLLWVLCLARMAYPQTTEFTYQGSFKDSGVPANGNYDLEFKLFNLVSGGVQQGGTLQRLNVPVAEGIFAVALDFGVNSLPGADRFLEIAVRTSGGGAFTQLSPRHKLTAAPYSIRSLNSANADAAADAAQLGGVAASQYVVTTDPRMTDARPPTAGSADYIQNGISPQASSNFNISGTGTASTFSAATQYNIGVDRILSNGGMGNLFAGVNAADAGPTGIMNSFFGAFAGEANTTANNNSFFGSSAGRSNSTGQGNSFFGSISGLSVTTGSGNSFFGRGSGGANTTGGGNSFFGDFAGNTNINGFNNTAIGSNADVLAVVSNATAIGYRAAVGQSNSLVLGSINGVNGSIADTKVGIGTTAPSERLHVVGNGVFAGDVSITGNLNTSGFFSATILSAGSQFNIGTDRVLSVTGTNNVYAGVNAGAAVPAGSNNAFFGTGAGLANAASNNSFFGQSAGAANTSGSSNAFFGRRAGIANDIGSFNNFFGASAGFNNTSGATNVFFGTDSGLDNTTGSNNTFVGVSTGRDNVSGSNNTALGRSANVGVGNLVNATAIGANAFVEQHNSLVLGSIDGVNGATSSANVGIGTTTPTDRLHVNGIIRVTALGAPGATHLCRNISGQISTCSEPPLADGLQPRPEMTKQREQIERQLAMIESLQKQVDQQSDQLRVLLALVCAQNPVPTLCSK